MPTNCTCQWKWCKDATDYPTRADDAVAKLYMSLEGITTDELYHQLKDLRCNDSKEEVWALAEKQAALPKSRRLQVRTWHALETNWQWNPTRISASAGSNTPVRAVHCIALPALLSSVRSPNSPLLIQDKPNIGSYTHVGNPVGTRHTPPPKGQHHWHAGKEWCKGPANAPVHTPADVTMAPPLSFDPPPLGPSRTEMAIQKSL